MLLSVFNGMTTAVDRAADSAPRAGRDFQGEIAALLARADAVRAEGDSIDVETATAAMLERTAAAADVAVARGGVAAEGARTKIAEQQERFKAGVLADGLSLDDEFDTGVRSTPDAGGSAPALSHGNKYAHMMDLRRHLQEQERAAA